MRHATVVALHKASEPSSATTAALRILTVIALKRREPLGFWHPKLAWYGRPSKPFSHWFYLTDAPIAKRANSTIPRTVKC
jgi:hypothetical protein